MKSVIVLALALVSATAFARPNTTALSCADAQDLVAREGSIVLNTGAPGLYERFVSSAHFCGNSEKAAAAYVTTADAASCKIGYYCGQGDSDSRLQAKKFPSQYGKCKVGARRLETYEEPGSDRNVNVSLVCNAAHKWVRADGYVAPAPKKFVCKEGSFRSENYEEPGSDRNVNVTVQCQGGKWKVYRKW
jgi:hypothetical protein